MGLIGPGIVVAATGIGAGDMIAAAVSGAKYSFVLLWAAIAGAVIKYFLNEGIARWQLSTGTTIMEAWVSKMNRWVAVYFIVYLFLWGFIVGGALIAACGLAAHAIFPGISTGAWGIIHSLLAIILVYFGRYKLLEKMMKVFIAMMFLVVIINAVMIFPDWGLVLKSLFIPSIPLGSGKFILGIIGGVGGSVTLLSYGYWIREKGWTGAGLLRQSRFDLVIAYTLTGLFGIAVMIIAAGVRPEVITGSKMVLGLAEAIEPLTGVFGKWIFLVGFWGAVFSSMLGVWQGVPYLFADFMKVYKNRSISIEKSEIRTNSRHYLFFMFYLAIPPMILLYAGKPVWVVIIYSIAGAFFMPFLAGSLIFLNNRKKWIGSNTYSLAVNFILIVAMILFLYLCIVEIIGAIY